MARIRVGTAGWVFEPWRDNFYPPGLKQKDELAYASRHLTAIEINGTFYSNQKPASFLAWAGQAPEDFVFSVKGHQRVTHILRLKAAETAVANFLASGVLALGRRLGPIIWQLPPNMKYDAERLESFLSILPQDPDAAAAMAREHDDQLKSPPHTQVDGIERIRHAIEVRHESFRTPELVALLRRYNVALVTADTAEWPWQDLTADFAYLRLQGPPGGSAYSPAERDAWADRLQAVAEGGTPEAAHLIAPETPKAVARDVYAFFVSTDKENAPHNAMAVQARLGIATAA